MAKGSRTRFSVGDVADVLKAGRQASEGADAPVSVRVLVDDGAPRDLVLAVRDALLPERAGAEVQVALLTSATTQAWVCDACVVVCGESPRQIREAALGLARRGVPVALVAESSLTVPPLDGLGLPDGMVSSVVASSPEVACSRLARWLVDATDKHLALAASFPFCRDAEVDRLVRSCALQNAAVGAVELIPGADLPVMTANQAKLVLQVAAAYGRGLNASRAPELAGVVAAGLAYRAVARRVCELAPGVGWLVKGSVGYAGTVATGRLAGARFAAEDAGITPRDALERVAEGARAVASAVSDLSDRLGELVPHPEGRQGASSALVPSVAKAGA